MSLSVTHQQHEFMKCSSMKQYMLFIKLDFRFDPDMRNVYLVFSHPVPLT